MLQYTMAYSQSIVLIDDDVDDQEIFKAACNLIGDSIQLIAFGTGESALHAIPSISPSPDLILLDLNMPRMNGIEVLTILKASSGLRSIPVVLYTTYFNQQVKEKCFSLGALDIIEKPNNFEVLCAKIESLLEMLRQSA